MKLTFYFGKKCFLSSYNFVQRKIFFLKMSLFYIQTQTLSENLIYLKCVAHCMYPVFKSLNSDEGCIYDCGYIFPLNEYKFCDEGISILC